MISLSFAATSGIAATVEVAPGANTAGLAGPIRRAVLLGASNLRRDLRTVVETSRRMWGRPLEILAACGLGRSYGMRMPFLWRELPGIAECGLWQALASRPSAPTAALVTDVGNDLLYDVPVPQIAAWVEACLDRLRQMGARVVLTPLPLCNVALLSRRRFLLLRSVLFPGCRLPYGTVMERALDLDRRLRLLAQRWGAVLVEHRAEWYGFDPIHIRRTRSTSAWSEILAPWSEAVSQASARKIRLSSLVAERQWIFGRERHRPQPCCRLADGTTLALY
jgi:hypothetical protein